MLAVPAKAPVLISLWKVKVPLLALVLLVLVREQGALRPQVPVKASALIWIL